MTFHSTKQLKMLVKNHFFLENIFHGKWFPPTKQTHKIIFSPYFQFLVKEEMKFLENEFD